ncbi:MAG: hypothetical protein GXY83_07375 [Rhodopirellula sp.]|nr:hypothetical protein [Rhodopirellula sp.]
MISTLSKIRQAGGMVVVLDGKVRIEAPPGLLSDRDKQILADHKQDLLRLLGPAETTIVADPEREAIQWIESLPPAEAEQVVETAIREWREIVGATETEAVETPVVDQVEATIVVSPIEATEVVEWEDGIEPPPPCDKCGSLELWETVGGSWHCQRCDPPIRSEMLRLRARRLRKEAEAA